MLAVQAGQLGVQAAGRRLGQHDQETGTRLDPHDAPGSSAGVQAS